MNRLCGSGLEAVIAANRAVAVGDASLTVAGGVESMSRAPWVLLKPAKGFPAGPETLHSTTLGWRMVNTNMPGDWTVSLGEATELLAEKYGITRDAQDAFALGSHQRAAAAWDGRRVRRRGRAGAGRRPRPRRVDPPRHHARGVGEAEAGVPPRRHRHGRQRLPAQRRRRGAAHRRRAGARPPGAGRSPASSSRGVAAVEPQYFGIGPVEAAELALRRAGIGWADLALVELNEAFAAQSLACLAEWPDLDPAIVNVHGGAIAIGHPLGCSGARIVGHLAHALHARGGGYGLAAICIGVGQGLAVVLEAEA